MYESLDKKIVAINPTLKVERVDRSDEKIDREISALREVFNRLRGGIYLDCNGSQYWFVGRLSDVEGIVGFCALRDYFHTGDYGVSALTHPKYETRLIATTLTKYAIDFSLAQENMFSLVGHVISDSASERVLEKLGFMLHHVMARRKRRSYENRTYHLDTTGKERIRRFSDVNQIDSQLPSLLLDLEVPSGHIASMIEQINWCGSLFHTRLQNAGDNAPSLGDTESILQNYYSDSFIYPSYPSGTGLSICDIACAARSVDAKLMGLKGRFGLEGQKIYYAINERRAKFAVIRSFEDEEEMFTLSLYEFVKKKRDQS